MSEATKRYLKGVCLKSELVKEIIHWKESCTKCIREVNGNLNSLKTAKAEKKREINAIRADLEDRLRQLEVKTEKQMYEIVAKEEETLKNFLKKLHDRLKRLEETEKVLHENIIGFNLKHRIEDGKHQTLAAREALLEINKHHMVSKVEFRVNNNLLPILGEMDFLGDIVLLTSHGEEFKREQQVQNKNSMFITAVNKNESIVLDHQTFMTNDNINGSETIINNDTLLELDSKYTHSLKPFLDSAKAISATCNGSIRNNQQSSKWDAANQKVFECLQLPKTMLSMRPNSEKSKEQHHEVKSRLSKSAREDSRLVQHVKLKINQNPNTLNEIDMNYAQFEEQGPDAVRRQNEINKKTLSVRYNEIDYVKEITALSNLDDSINIHKHSPQSIAHSTECVSLIPLASLSGSRTSLQSSKSISSVSYKPSSALASGPVYITPSEISKSQSYFTYVARFHTKKHPFETDLCRLTGIAALESGHIVVSDISHLQVLLFSQDFNYLDAIECPSPCGMTVVAQDIIAVTLFHSRKLLLIKVHTAHLERYKEVHVGCSEVLHAVRFRAGLFYVMCFAGDVHVLDNEGKQIIVLKTDLLVGQARHLEVDEEGQIIFVSGGDRVLSLSKNGERQWQYSCSTVHRRFCPGGLALHNNRLFVTDWGRHRVLELSVNGTHVRDVIVDNVEYPQELTVHKPSGKMFVTQSNMFKQEARSRRINVFEIK